MLLSSNRSRILLQLGHLYPVWISACLRRRLHPSSSHRLLLLLIHTLLTLLYIYTTEVKLRMEDSLRVLLLDYLYFLRLLLADVIQVDLAWVVGLESPLRYFHMWFVDYGAFLAALSDAFLLQTTCVAAHSRSGPFGAWQIQAELSQNVWWNLERVQITLQELLLNLNTLLLCLLDVFKHA